MITSLRRVKSTWQMKAVARVWRRYSDYDHAAFARKVREGPTLSEFMAMDREPVSPPTFTPNPLAFDDGLVQLSNTPKKYYIETYGCQMNVSDSEIVQSVLDQVGLEKVAAMEEADVILANTCAIREKAEQRVWERLQQFKMEKLKRERFNRRQPPAHRRHPVTIGVLGCMAERLKTKLLESDRLVDVVVGPDAYRDLPNLLKFTEKGGTAINVQLSIDETYADISPVRVGDDMVSSFVSIMRGCNNTCTYCIVPFTRGRERSRDVQSILDEVKTLSERGYREVVLLGQNVNSYMDDSTPSDTIAPLSTGFGSIVRRRHGGLTFTELVDRVSRIDPNMRVRFTSPHPKDFPDDLLHLIQERPNVCKYIHIPAQSGNSAVLERMRRLYTRESYLALIARMREVIPGVSLSTDIIAGFCGESEDQHQDTVSLMHLVQYDFAYMFAYSMREKTAAHRRYSDDVSQTDKIRRLEEIISAFRSHLPAIYERHIGSQPVVLVEGTSRRNTDEWLGRTDDNFRVVFPKAAGVGAGDYCRVEVEGVHGQTLRGRAISGATDIEGRSY